MVTGSARAGGQAATGVQTLTCAIAVRVVMPRPAPGKAWRVLVLRSRCQAASATARTPRPHTLADRHGYPRGATHDHDHRHHSAHPTGDDAPRVLPGHANPIHHPHARHGGRRTAPAPRHGPPHRCCTCRPGPTVVAPSSGVAASLRPGGRFAWNAFAFDHQIAARLDGEYRDEPVPHKNRYAVGDNRIDIILAPTAPRR